VFDPARLTTPAARLVVLVLAGVLAAGAMLAAMLQPDSPPFWTLANLRPIGTIPHGFWVSWSVGLGAWLVSAWVFALKPGDGAIRLFALSGAMTLAFTFAGGFSDLAMPVGETAAILAKRINAAGASGFGMAIIALFAIYPAPLPGARAIFAANLAGFGGWTLAVLVGPPEGLGAVQAITFFEMLAIMALALIQAARPWRDPGQRAIAVWLGLSVLVGAGPFIGLVATPLTFGYPALLDENVAFASFILFYIGIAIGLMRYRLFDLGTWAYGLLFYALAGAALMLVDMALISVLALSPTAAFAATLGLVAVTWLPLRDLVWSRVMRRRRTDEAALFASVVESVLRPTAEDRAAAWRALTEEIFAPLEVIEGDTRLAAAQLGEDGKTLALPPALGAPALVLRHKQKGRALFTRGDEALARQLVSLAEYVETSRSAYDQGVNQERLRIARDIHDNIGAQLMQALHSREAPRKDAMIRNTLSDLREIINNSQGTDLPLAALLADLRVEAGERLAARGIVLDWHAAVPEGLALATSEVHSLRSAIREATSNVIKHSGAARMRVAVAHEAGAIRLTIADDGCGLAAGDALGDAASDRAAAGHGLANMRTRFVSMGGDFAIAGDGAGTTIAATLPVGRATAVPPRGRPRAVGEG
jgi:signal transduction histidine kinase